MRRALAAATLVCATSVAQAVRIDVVGLFPGKAVIAVDGSSPKSLSVGETFNGVKLVAVTANDATFVVDGRHETVALGSYRASPRPGARSMAVLNLDGRGHYVAEGAINGVATRFLVDTGASLVILSAAEADRMALRHRDAPKAMANTANGTVAFRTVKLDRVRVGDIELANVDAGVLEGYEGPSLLGMSFLSRTEVSRDGQAMVLTRRF